MKKKELILCYYDNNFYQSDIIIKICGAEKKTKTWIEHSASLDYDIWIVIDGTISIATQSQKFTLNKGDAFFFFPDIEYEATCLSDGCSFIFSHFDFRIGYNNRALDIYDINTYYPYSEIANLVDPFLELFEEFEKKEKVSFLTLKGNFLNLIAKFIQLKGEKPVISATKPKSILKLLPALSYINSHLTTQINIKTLAKTTLFSEKYFCSLFKETMGVSPIKYINDLKLDKSLEYLYEEKYSIREISEMLGYGDQFVYSKSFKKKFGVSPSAITKKVIMKNN